MQKYRCAIVGCGPRARMHALAYELIDRGELVACCDLDDGRKIAFSQQFGIPGYADALDMLRQERPDVVHLVTPPHNRAELMSLVQDQNVPACIVEKPIAYQVSDWRELVRLEATAKTKFAVNHQFRWHTNLARCRAALQSRRLGHVRFLDLSAGMNVSGQGTHILDYAMSLNEDTPVVEVFGAASGARGMAEYHPAPDSTAGHVLFANGVHGMWVNGPTAPRTGDATTTWQHVRVAAYTERGHVLWEEFGKWEILSPDGLEAGRTADMEAWHAGNHAAQAGLTSAVFDWIEDDKKPAGTNLRIGLHQWEVVLALYASALWRKPVEIPFDPPKDLFPRLADAMK
jgi:predicted dehydrogenase